MATGKVKWFNNAKGYGFIRPDTGGEDLFVHYSYICMDGYRSLKAGQAVTYEAREAPKGQHAMDINIVQETTGTEAISEPEIMELDAPQNELDSETLHSQFRAEAV